MIFFRMLHLSIMVIIISFSLYGFQSNDEKEILKTLYKQLEAGNKEDLYGYLETIDSKSQGYSQVKSQLQKLFSIYDLRTQCENIKVLSIKNGVASVRVTTTTRKISGPEFANNRTVTINKLRKVQGKWKLFDTKYLKFERL